MKTLRKVDASGDYRTLGIRCGRWRRAVRNEQSWKKKVLSCIFSLSARDNLGRSTDESTRLYEEKIPSTKLFTLW